MKFHKSFFFWSACATLVYPTTLALADGAGNGVTVVDDRPRNSSDFVFNYGPPQDPALNLLNLQASKANISSSPQDFLMSLPGLINGSANQNLGLDFTPAWALRDIPPFGKIYTVPSRYSHILYNAQMEIAETQGTDSTTPSKLQPSGIAIGVYTSLLTDSEIVSHRVV